MPTFWLSLLSRAGFCRGRLLLAGSTNTCKSTIWGHNVCQIHHSFFSTPFTIQSIFQIVTLCHTTFCNSHCLKCLAKVLGHSNCIARKICQRALPLLHLAM